MYTDHSLFRLFTLYVYVSVRLYWHESEIAFRWVHRESTQMFTLTSDKDQRQESASPLIIAQCNWTFPFVVDVAKRRRISSWVTINTMLKFHVNELVLTQTRSRCEQESIPVGCVPSTAVAISPGTQPPTPPPLPVNRMTDKHVWKHFLSATSFADGHEIQTSFTCFLRNCLHTMSLFAFA